MVFFLICLMGEIMAKRAKGDKVKVLFQGLQMTRIISMLVYSFVFWIPHLTIHFRYKYMLTNKLILYPIYNAFMPLSCIYMNNFC
jgi:hypothetical protein